MTREEFIEKANSARLENKDRWVMFIADVEGTPVGYKAYRTWVQILRNENTGVRDAGPIDCSVKVYKAWLSDTLDRIL